MPYYSELSKQRLSTCHPILRKIFRIVIQIYGCTIICGWRGEQEQNEAFNSSNSTKEFPDSYHNKLDENDKPESWAVDAIPDEGGWKATERQWYIFAGLVIGIGFTLGYKITWGRDWDKDYDFDDQKLMDYAHFQIERLSN